MQQKRDLILLANRFAIAGLGVLALAMTGAIVLITDVLFGGVVTVITGVGTVSVFAAFWYVLPLRRRLSLTRSRTRRSSARSRAASPARRRGR